MSISSTSIRIFRVAVYGSLALGAVACGSTGGSSPTSPGDASSGRDVTLVDGGHEGGHKDGGELGGDAGGSDGGAGGCVQGRACDGGVCAGGACCPSSRACGGTCCGSGLLCSFDKCVTPGASCFDSTDCDGGQYCQYSVSPGDGGAGGSGDGSCAGGALPQGLCLPLPPTCADAGKPDASNCIESCTYRPEAGTFAPVLKYQWGGGPDFDAGNPTDIMMAPIAVPMKDTNCDGKVNSEDIPDLVFTTFLSGNYHTAGTLHAIRVSGGAFVEDWSAGGTIMVGGAPFTIEPGYLIAGGDLDGQPGAEIVACLVDVGDAGTSYGVAAFHTDGSVYWTAAVSRCFMPSIADLNQDGQPEVIVDGAILNGQTGAVTPFTSAAGATVANVGPFVVSDLDGDGFLDVIGSNAAYHADGHAFVETPAFSGGFPAVGDFDHDGEPEVVAVSDGRTTVWHYVPGDGGTNYAFLAKELDSTDIAGYADSGACANKGGGPPTIADFNGDGVPDIAFAGSIVYTVYDGAKIAASDAGAGDAAVPGTDYYLWRWFPTDDCSSSSTGSTIFDFTASGKPQVLYSDQQKLRVFNGPDGGVLWQTCNTTGTLWEYPIVLDVDNDGHADIVVVSNAYASKDTTVACQDYDGGPTGESGLRVFSDPSFTWVRTRALWNEHAYHITNVNDDGTIPSKEAPNWVQPGLNNFRQNKAPGYELAAADAVVSLALQCGSTIQLTAVVQNLGEAAIPPGVVVDFYAGTPPNGTLVGSASTTVPLYPAQSQAVTPTSLAGAAQQASSFYAIVDPASAPPHPAWHECRTDDKTSAVVKRADVCGGGPK